MSMKNVTILISNVKGGCGKTTLSSLLSTYLVEKGFPVVTFDSDTQLSLMKNRRDDLSSIPQSVEEPWKVFPLRADKKVADLLENIKTLPSVVVIDCPGSVDNPNLQYIFQAADIVVMPFSFDRINIRETATFAEMFTKISKARILFLPNMITQYDTKREALRKAKEKAESEFPKYGNILPSVAECLAVRDSNTLSMNYKQRWAISDAFNGIISEIKKKSNKPCQRK